VAAPEPFRINVSPTSVADLTRRLREALWPEGVADESGGIPVSRVRELAQRWRDDYDWRKHEESLNRHSHFRAAIGDHTVHFVHARRAEGATELPILLLHGWPGSFLELLGIAERIGHRRDVVVPSLPGFGFSSIPSKPRTSNRAIAELMVGLMATLGYGRFAVHGGDVGAGVASWMAYDFPQAVAGLHLNFIPGSFAPEAVPEPSDLEEDFLAARRRFAEERGAYAHLQRTRPLTLAYGLSDSPVGLLAWIAEKFDEWSDPASSIPDETLLTNVSIYWFTKTIGSSLRLYMESAATPLAFRRGERIAVPTGVALFPYEIAMPPRSWVERVYDVVHWTDMPRGGHFAALEQPALLAHDVETFLAALDAGGDTSPR
jgi:pimeloyl-ACP methyl ester carboxylesterase